jgi:hypothetical protein
MPNVYNSKRQSKANIWNGIQRSPSSARLYQSGSGVAAAYFAVRWAANYGNGACDRTVYERYVWRDLVAPNKPSGSDDGYANKHGIGMEIIHEGTGAPCDDGVWELAAQINAAAMDVFGWSIARIIDHRTSTRRKVDIDFKQKQGGYSINALRTRVAEIHAGTDPPPLPEVDMFWIPMKHGWGMGRLDDPTYRAVVAFMQRHLNEQPVVDPKVKNDGQYGDKTATALAQRFGGNGMGVNGNQMATLVLEAKSGGGDGYDHTGLEKKVAEGAVKLTAHKASTDHHNLYVTGVAVEGPTP